MQLEIRAGASASPKSGLSRFVVLLQGLFEQIEIVRHAAIRSQLVEMAALHHNALAQQDLQRLFHRIPFRSHPPLGNAGDTVLCLRMVTEIVQNGNGDSARIVFGGFLQVA